MSNINTLNYKQKLDGILKNCRFNMQHPRQSSQENNLYPNTCKSKPLVRNSITQIQPCTTQNKQQFKPNLFKSNVSKLNTDPYKQEQITLDSACKENANPQALFLTRANRVHSITISSISPSAMMDSNKTQKICDLLDHLIKNADDDRKMLKISANKNMPLQTNIQILPENILKNNTSTNNSAHFIEQSDLDNNIFDDQAQEQINTLKRQNDQLKQIILEKDYQINEIQEQNNKLKSLNDRLIMDKKQIESEHDSKINNINAEHKNLKDSYDKRLEELDRERNCLEEVLKNFLLKRELDKLRGSSCIDTSMQISSLCLSKYQNDLFIGSDNKQNQNNFSHNDIIKYVESKNIQKGQMMFLFPNDILSEPSKES